MKEATGDMWKIAKELNADAIVITTNGHIRNDGLATVGRGCAKQAADRYPHFAEALAHSINNYGLHCSVIHSISDNRPKPLHILSFPVKPAWFTVAHDRSNVVKYMQAMSTPGTEAPGWKRVADAALIIQSANELRKHTDDHDWKNIVMPRPGCGAGELSWEAVYYMLNAVLDDRFTVCSF